MFIYSKEEAMSHMPRNPPSFPLYPDLHSPSITHTHVHIYLESEVPKTNFQENKK